MELNWLVIFFARHSFPSQSLKRIGEDLSMQSACQDNQRTYERDTVRRLHCCINMTSHITGMLNDDKKEFRVGN